MASFVRAASASFVFCGGGGGETCTAAFKSPDSGGPDEHAFSLRNIDRGSPSEVGFVVRHFCRTNTPHPPAPGNAPVHCYTGSLFTHHYPQSISLRLSTSGQEAGYNVALTSSIRLAMVVSEIRCLGPRVTTTPPPCNVRCGKIPIVQREIYMPA